MSCANQQQGFPARSPDEALVPLEDIPAMLKDLPVKYDDWALSSYETFKILREEGVIPPHIRFQVCLPTPISIMIVLFYQPYRTTIEPIWEEILLKALRRIQDNIPHEDLLIQWDIVQELSLLEGAPYKKNNYGLGKESTAWFDPVPDGVFDRLVRLASHVDSDVPMGIHMCYGDFMHQHFIDPPSTEQAAAIVNALVTKLNRKLDYFQFPVPANRDDDAYFQPLKEQWEYFKEKGAYAYVGMMHPQDEQGARRVVEIAQRALGTSGWGVAAECGLGRETVENAESVMDIGKTISRPWTS